MKLLLCTNCFDVVKLVRFPRRCSCGECGGIVEDGLNAKVFGGVRAVILGFSNKSLYRALTAQRDFGDLLEVMGGVYGSEVKGREFTAFVIPDSAPTVRREETQAERG